MIVSSHARVTVSNLGIATVATAKATQRSLWSYASSACYRLAKFVVDAVSVAASAHLSGLQ